MHFRNFDLKRNKMYNKRRILWVPIKYIISIEDKLVQKRILILDMNFKKKNRKSDNISKHFNI